MEISSGGPPQAIKDPSSHETIVENCKDPLHGHTDVTASTTEEKEKCWDEGDQMPLSETESRGAEKPVNQSDSATHTPAPGPDDKTRTSIENTDESAICSVGMEVSCEREEVRQTCAATDENSSILDTQHEEKPEQNSPSFGDRTDANEVTVQPVESPEQSKSSSNVK